MQVLLMQFLEEMLFGMKPSLQIHCATPLRLVQLVDRESQAGGCVSHRSVPEDKQRETEWKVVLKS